jgi:redox-sensing transcriptional repressor
MKSFKVPEATVSRLSIYSRYLEQMEQNNVLTVSSTDIAKSVGVTPAQVRKDLAYFGEFGTRGVGYSVKDLLGHIMKILGLNKDWNVVIIGAGNLGRALSAYKGFGERGFKIVAMFDNDPKKVQSCVGSIDVIHIDKLPDKTQELGVDLCIIAVPAQAAQESVDIAVKSGIKGIINFAPTTLNVPKGVLLRRVDLAAQLEVLTFNLREK